MHALEDFWSRTVASRTGRGRSDPRDDQVLLAALKLGLRETLDFLVSQKPSYPEFEAWVLGKNGGSIDSAVLERLAGGCHFQLESILPEPILSMSDMAFWDENGYVVVRNAVGADSCLAAVDAILEHAEMTLDEPDSWYRGDFWIPLAHHSALWANRNSPRIHTAFAQIWGRGDLWMNVDVCGVNPPMREGYGFRGTPLHWDMTLAPPHYFGTQAILYLTDTAANQGAFSCVPGFHRRLEQWLRDLPEGANPRALAPTVLHPIPVAGSAGDLIIWHQALPHAATPNLARLPRIVQYMNMFPGQQEVNTEWR